MKIKLLISKSCLPCDRAKHELLKVLKIHTELEVELIDRPHKDFETYNVVYTPTLVVDLGTEVHQVTGAHVLKKIDIIGLLKDLEIINC